MITYISDKIRMIFGDSTCPLYSKCSGADKDSDTCVSYRGRNELGGDRAECYRLFKPIIRTQKEGLLSRLAEKLAKGLLHIGGLEE